MYINFNVNTCFLNVKTNFFFIFKITNKNSLYYFNFNIIHIFSFKITKLTIILDPFQIMAKTAQISLRTGAGWLDPLVL